MNILGIDDTLAGLRRGAAKFGTRVAERVARKFGVRKNAKVPPELAKVIAQVLDAIAQEHAPGDEPMRVSHMVGRVLRKADPKFHYEDISAAVNDELDRRGWSRHQMSNSFTPREPEPYGLGMGGADTEQASQPPTQARENDGAPAAAPSSGAVDSSSLGYESGQETTTAQRSEMLSRCLGCGLESPEAKVSKCMGCGLEDIDTGQRMPLASLTDLENASKFDMAKRVWLDADHVRREAILKECGCLVSGVAVDVMRTFNELPARAQDYLGELSERKNAGSKCKSCGESRAELSPDGTCAKCEGMENAGQSLSTLRASWADYSQRWAWLTEELGISEDEADDLVDLPFSNLPSTVIEKMKNHFPGSPSNSLNNAAHPDLKAWWDQADLSQRELLLEDAGASGSHQMATLHFENLPADVKKKIESMRGTLGNSRANAGHLGPDAWEAATESERVGWLDAASQDIDLACRRWPDLSLDVHVALQDAFDKPANRNLTDALDHHDRGQLTPLADRLNADGHPCAECQGSGKIDSGHPCHACAGSGHEEVGNADGKPAKRKFVFRDVNGEEETVEAISEAAAWDTLANIFGTPVADIKGMGVKLVKTLDNAANDPKYRCSECGEVTQAAGPDETVLKCPKCGGATDFDNASDASGRVLACPSCKSTKLVTADRQAYGDGFYECDACGDGTWSRDELSKMGSVKNAKAQEPCAACGLPMQMRPSGGDENSFVCGNRRCTAFRTASGGPSEHFRKLNADTPGDVEEIERHVEGIEHELKEIKGLDNSGVKRGTSKYGPRQNALFAKGDRVKSDVDAQGMKRGELGTIEDMDEQSTAFGTFVTYSVKLDSGKTVAVGNGHLVLSKA